MSNRVGAHVPPEIVCVDCGGRCRLLSHMPEDGFRPGDVVAYRCTDCLDRWDVEVPDEADEPPEPPEVAPAPRRRRRGTDGRGGGLSAAPGG